MATWRSILSCTGFLIGTRGCRYQASILSPNSLQIISKRKDKCPFLGNQSSRFLNTGVRELIVSKTKMDLSANSSIQPGPSIPSDPSSAGSWKGWIVGMLVTVILPFLANKWGPLLKLKNEVETAVETADHVADMIENVAEKVEEVAEEIADHLPAGGKLKEIATYVENVAKETAKDAHQADVIIEKIEKAEQQVESFIDPIIDKANVIPKEVNDQN